MEHRNSNLEEILNNSQIICALINKEINYDILKVSPYRDWMDLALIYKLKLDPTVVGENGAYITINNKIMDMLNYTERGLYKEALNNLGKVCIRDIRDIIADLGGPAYVNTDEPQMYVVTNEDGLFGASQLLRPFIFKLLADEYDTDVYIIPSSIHELIVTPKIYTTDEVINELICSVNENEVPYDCVLTDHAYTYSRKTDSINIVEA